MLEADVTLYLYFRTFFSKCTKPISIGIISEVLPVKAAREKKIIHCETDAFMMSDARKVSHLRCHNPAFRNTPCLKNAYLYWFETLFHRYKQYEILKIYNI